MSALEVRAWGIGGACRDAGRPGWAHLGRSRGGAVDLAGLALANRLVGNAEDVTGIETSGGLVLVVRRPVVLAVAGSPADLDVDGGPPLGWGVATALPGGATVRVGRLRGGARTYVAVRGGIARERDGALDVGPQPRTPPSAAAAAPHPRREEVRLWPGPRLDLLADGAWQVLLSTTWTVQADSDRVGVRLAGAVLADRGDGAAAALASEGLLEGAVQVPPDGRPIVMLADHPVTGGYPVAAVVDPADLGDVAQAPPGATIRFRRASRSASQIADAAQG